VAIPGKPPGLCSAGLLGVRSVHYSKDVATSSAGSAYWRPKHVEAMKLHTLSHLVGSLPFNKILDFKLSPCCDCCVPSFGRYSGVLILCFDVFEHSCSETSAHKIQTPGNHPKERIQQM
jgi:hypothetical protein